ncbi:MAG: leucine-rich repeat domain-containing protein [Bacteroidaceae bacterium]|nr:leucine-rich repeat domain-containing protein [Bacteroidaceae bacterium]
MKTLKYFATIVAMLLCCITANAYSFEVDGIYYNSYGSNSVEVTYKDGNYNSYSGDVVIPETVTYNDVEYKVTSIGYRAFKNCSGLTSVTIPQGVTTIGSYAFDGCSGLTSVYISSIEDWCNIDFLEYHSNPFYYAKNIYLNGALLEELIIPSGITEIKDYTFRNWQNITSVTIPQGVTTIGSSAFSGCSGLTSVYISSIEDWCNIDFAHGLSNPCYYAKNVYLNGALLEELIIPSGITEIKDYTFWNWQNITSVTIPQGVTTIGSDAFSYCSGLTSVTIPQGVTTIGSHAFSYCSGLKSVTIPQGVTSIGDELFYGVACEIKLISTTPPSISSYTFNNSVWFIVPAANYDDYCAATYWADMKDRIAKDDVNVQNVALSAASDKSDLQVTVGDENLRFVTDLTISGTINSYDFMILRNKMPLLRHLDLSQANIVANSYEHYTGYHTKDNIFPAYGLHNCNLITLSFPASIKSIGIQGLSSNDYLREVSIHEGVTSIGSSAFSGCGSLSSVNLPEGVTSIGSLAFKNCSSLTSISLPESLTSIGSDAFYNCSSLTSVKLSPNLKTIGSSAFYSCSKLSEIHIPASVRSIGDYAFYSCSNMEDVYVYIVEPTDIGQNTFTKSGNNFIGTLHAPKVSYWDYYYNTQWSQFLDFAEFDGKYDNFYLEGDKVLDNTTGSIEGEEGKNPDAEMGNNSGIIVEDDVNQDLGDVDIEHDGENGGSIIVDGNGEVNADNLNFRISVTGGRWYFFCFPFDVKAEDIRCEGGAEWVFRYYDGEERAKNGKGGWKNVTSDGNGNFLKAATGYIFQCSKNDVLVISAKNGQIKKENKFNELVEHVTENMHDASWNFVGNPYLSYYEVTSEDYSAPITVWDGSKYIAIRPGDDDYQLAPFEAFFVQKPEGKDKVNYKSDNQMTRRQAVEAATQARQARAQQAINPNRLLVNITLTDGKETDRARVVFNESAEAGYETECDAAKFGTDGVPQIYTMDSNNVKYAINERPMAQGNVSMGYSVPKQGTYTLAATRMDIAVYLMDNLTGTIHDLAKGGYEFCSESGTFGSRFTLIVKGDATGIDGVLDADADAPIYNVKGQQVKDMNHSDIYIQNNHKMVKK